MELCLVLDVLNPLILWPISTALGGLLFFEIANHCWRLDPVPRASEARSKAIGPAYRPQTLAARRERPGQADLQGLNEYSWERARLVDPVGQRQPDPMRGRVMVSIRVIGEDDAVALANGKAEFELDAVPVTSSSARGPDEWLGRSHFDGSAKAGCWLRQAAITAE
jgi:hypothetical protein